MKETLVMSSVRTVTPSLFGSPSTAVPTLLKYLGMSAKSVALSQIIHREAIIAGAVTVGLR